MNIGSVKRQVTTLNNMVTLGNRAIATGLDHLFGEYGAQNVKNASEQLLGAFLAVYAFLYERHEGGLTDAQIVSSIRQAKLKVRVDRSGNVTKAVLKVSNSVRITVGEWHVDHCPPRCHGKVRHGNHQIKIGKRRRLLSHRSGHFVSRDAVYQGTHDGIESASSSEPVVIQNQHGNTTYIIHNLNVFLTADVVHQLNVNPKEVVNMIQEQLKEQIENGKK